MKKNIYKNIIMILVSMVMLFAINGCKKTDKTDIKEINDAVYQQEELQLTDLRGDVNNI